MDIAAILKILSAGSNGSVGTQASPWNPAARLEHGLPQGGAMPSPMTPGANSPEGIGNKALAAIVPQTMAGKGGASGG